MIKESKVYMYGSSDRFYYTCIIRKPNVSPLAWLVKAHWSLVTRRGIIMRMLALRGLSTSLKSILGQERDHSPIASVDLGRTHGIYFGVEVIPA